jgi:hypothetical protein
VFFALFWKVARRARFECVGGMRNMRQRGIRTRWLWVGMIAALMVSGCAFRFGQRAAVPAPTPVVITTPAAPTSLTDAAKDMLAAAEQSVTTAEVTRTLWTSARQKLLAAREAAKVFDSERTILLSREVIQLCVRSAEQAKSAPVTW